MSTWRCMFVGQGGSLLPEDRFVNVFHFHDEADIPDPTDWLRVSDLVESFYTAPTAGGNSIGNFISNYVSRTAKLIVYNLLEAEPRVPHEVSITLPSAVGAGMAEEVAICLSYTGAPPITARRRGRIYIGPLSSSGSVMAGATTTLPSRPAMSAANEVCNTIVAAADRLLDEATTASMQWVIRSTVPSENFVPITAGYVDNAWDTQRRRGPDPTARLTFGF